jgi:hypothetical protein
MVTRNISSADMIDRILDKGVVVDSWQNFVLGGIDGLMSTDALYVITSLQSPRNYYIRPFWEAAYYPPPDFYPLPVEAPRRRRRRRRSNHRLKR